MSRWITDPTTGLFTQLAGHMTTVIPALIPSSGATKNKVGAHGVWIVQQINRVPFEDLTEPYGVIVIPSFPRMSMGAANAVFNPHVQLYVVAEQTWNGLEIAAYLEDLRDYMEASANLSCGQVDRVTELNWGDELDANQLLTEKGSASRAGRVVVSLWVGETITTTN